MKSEKGFTGVDIAISVIVITMFVAIIALLMSRFNSSSNELELKSEAVDIAIQEIEKVKEAGIDNAQNEEESEISEKPGFYKKIEIVDYAENKTDKVQGLVKKATVTISYIYKNQEQKVELSTILEKEL